MYRELPQWAKYLVFNTCLAGFFFFLFPEHITDTFDTISYRFIGVTLLSCILTAGTWMKVRDYICKPAALCALALSAFSGPVALMFGYGVAVIYSLPALVVTSILLCRANGFSRYDTFQISAVVFIIILRFIADTTNGHTHWDIWQIYDLSNTFFSGNLYEASMYRCLAWNHSYSASFPYLYPLLMALVNLFTVQHCGAYLYLNYVSLIFTLIFVWKIVVDAGGKWIFFPVAVIILIIPAYLRELSCGGTTPFTLMCATCLFWLLCVKNSKPLSRHRLACIGAIAALGSMARFDFCPVLFLLVLGLGIHLLTHRRYTDVLWLVLPVVVIVIPWVIYSLDVFGTLFATDNGRRILNAENTLISTFFMPGEHVDTVLNNPEKWYVFFSKRFSDAWWAFYQAVKFSSIPLLSVMWLCCGKGKGLLKPRSFLAENSRQLLLIASVALGALAIMAAGYGGYTCLRYYSPFIAVCSLFLIHSNLSELRRWYTKAMICSIFALTLGCHFYKEFHLGWSNLPCDNCIAAWSTPKRAISGCCASLKGDNAKELGRIELPNREKYDGVLKVMLAEANNGLPCVLNVADGYSLGPQYTACRYFKSLGYRGTEPRRVATCLATYNVTHVYTGCQKEMQELLQSWNCIEKTSIDGLFRVHLEAIPKELYTTEPKS